MPDEFNLIEKYLAPLAAPEGLSLLDDAACVPMRLGHDQILTKDVLVAGTHFFNGDDPISLAFKAVSVNVSDLAAKGAEPAFYMLGLSLPKTLDAEPWLEKFVAGLSEAQRVYGLQLLGGDSTSTSGPLTISITAIGYVPNGTMIRRNGAKAGDNVYVTGNLGEAAFALQAILGNIKAPDISLASYYKPRAQHLTGQALRGIASAAADVSDGLLADVGHIAKASGAKVTLQLDLLPYSTAVNELTIEQDELLQLVYSGGDDYQIVFTASECDADELARLTQENGVKITRIGKVVEGSGVEIIDTNGKKVQVSHQGFNHFSGN
ncbi:thiamine-phosphate kinase [Kordiimonas laminariae]|uniref:thiamine-phosphate kinase n=1 Tax=Kordiimonas laminariae TaxID=2917717 RepID=UPI001FF61325|nr:thiamine-phosphate kinase [Kordiimonas laminariae]MCK0070404.1 thiamine-phosphate kinase [Kordiimonas laminariae]